MDEGAAILVDAHSPARIAQLTTGIVCTRIVASTRAKQFSPVRVVVSCVEVVSVEPSVTGCGCLRINALAALRAYCAVGTVEGSLLDTLGAYRTRKRRLEARMVRSTSRRESAWRRRAGATLKDCIVTITRELLTVMLLWLFRS